MCTVSSEYRKNWFQELEPVSINQRMKLMVTEPVMLTKMDEKSTHIRLVIPVFYHYESIQKCPTLILCCYVDGTEKVELNHRAQCSTGSVYSVHTQVFFVVHLQRRQLF